ncbi:MAG TPA: PAS domain-containing protein [Pilimelia sp.]|nr:PAS domain-containing protein [Pilimelia sp.]
MPAEADLRLVADLIPHIVWVASAHGAIEYVNRRATDYNGEAPGECTDAGWDWQAWIHPADLPGVRGSWADAITGSTAVELDCRLRRADGEFRWHRLHGVPVRDDAGRVVRWVGTCTDIEDQKALEEQLWRAQRDTAASLTLLEALQSAAPVGFGFADRDLRFVRVNETLVEINSRSMADHLGQPMAGIVPAAVWPSVEAACRQVLDTGVAVPRLDASLASATGQIHSWLASYYPVRVAGDIVGVGFVVVDVTEHRQAQEFRSVVMDNMAEGLYTTDERGRVTSMNRAAVRILGWPEEELLGRPMHDTVHFRRADGSPYPAAECPLGRVRADGEVVQVSDEVYVRQDGSLVGVSYSAAPLHVGDAVAGVVVVFRDISELRQRQQQEIEARHDQKLESLGRLSAGLAHEINTPIQFVGDNTRFLAEAYQQMLELLLVYRDILGPAGGQLSWQERKDRAAEAEDKADIEYLAAEVPVAVEQSLEGTERVASLVRAMKAFSYKDSKDHAYADINEAIRTTATVARNEVKYVADLALELGEVPEILCHVGDLNQVFLNLLVNAADALQDRGERGQIRVTTRMEDASVVITFGDNGSGIPADIQKTIFEPFFTTKGVGKGTGQGLALARAVCEKHGGTIEVWSEPGQGTEFTLRLPVAGKRATPS